MSNDERRYQGGHPPHHREWVPVPPLTRAEMWRRVWYEFGRSIDAADEVGKLPEESVCEV